VKSEAPKGASLTLLGADLPAVLSNRRTARLGGRSLRVVDVQFEFQCECGANGCDGRVLMTLDE
jgi:hypothetical protein